MEFNISQRTAKPTIRPVCSKDYNPPVHRSNTARILAHPTLDSPEAVDDDEFKFNAQRKHAYIILTPLNPTFM